MRYFPSAVRPRLAALAAGSVALAVLAIPLAQASDEDDLKDRQRDVQSQLGVAADDLHEASRAATRAVQRFEAAQARLEGARSRLAGVRVRLEDARARDLELQQALGDAEEALRVADEELAEGTADVDDQQDQVRETVLRLYTQGDPGLRAVGTFFDARDLSDITRQQTAEEVLLSKESNVFDVLEQVQSDLAQEQVTVADRTAEVDVRRQQAAAHLDTVRGLVEQARTARDRVQSAVGTAREARRAALDARAGDRDTIRQLRVQDRKIAARLKALAERQANQRGYVGSSGGYLSLPVEGYVTSPFGYRTHPIYGYYALHDGTDFGAGCGTPLTAAASGTVLDTYYSSSYGNRLFLSIGNVNGKNLVLIYNHLSGYAASQGERLERGETLGYVGSTGWSTGCHLHFTVMADGVAVDPMNYL